MSGFVHRFFLHLAFRTAIVRVGLDNTHPYPFDAVLRAVLAGLVCPRFSQLFSCIVELVRSRM
jgi:hypothetical protein